MLRLETGQVPPAFAKKKELLKAYLPIYRNAVRRTCALARSTWQSRYNICYQNKMAEDRECRIVKQVEEFLTSVTPSTLEQAKAEFEKAFEEAWMRHGEDPVPDLEACQKQLLREVHHHMVNARSELHPAEASAEPERFNSAHSQAMDLLSRFSEFCHFVQRYV
ncbi:unnamed protein product, partial [Effrenium voratum]